MFDQSSDLKLSIDLRKFGDGGARFYNDEVQNKKLLTIIWKIQSPIFHIATFMLSFFIIHQFYPYYLQVYFVQKKTAHEYMKEQKKQNKKNNYDVLKYSSHPPNHRRTYMYKVDLIGGDNLFLPLSVCLSNLFLSSLTYQIFWCVCDSSRRRDLLAECWQHFCDMNKDLCYLYWSSVLLSMVL